MLKTLLLIVFGATAWGYAQLGEEMKCANGECTETVSEGRAKLAYQPRDKKFLNLKKGDVVLVKGKKAGMKTDLWGGEEFLKRVFPEKEDVSIISNADQEIKIQKQAKDKKENDDNQAEQTSVKENELDLNKEDQPKDREENDDNQAKQTLVKENELNLNKEDQPKDREENDDNQDEQTSVKKNELDLNKEDQPKDREENDDNVQFKQTFSVEENEPDLNKEDTKSDVQNVDSDKHDSDIEKPKSEESAGAIISQDNGGSDEKENKSTDQTENKNETKDFRGDEDQTENKSLKDSTLSETSNEDIVNESNKSSNSDKMAANSLLKPADNDKESVVDANEDAKKSFSKDIASAEDAEQQESKETKPAEEEREKVLSTEVSSEAVEPKKDAASSENINDKESAPGEELLTKSSQNSSENTSILSASNSSSVADGQEQALTAETDKLKATSQDENASVFPDQGTNSNNLPLEATTKGKTSDLKNNISVEVSENKSTPGDDSSKPNSTKNTENSLGQKNITMDNDEEEPSRTKQDSPLINKEEIKEESPDASSSNKSPNDDSSLIPQEVGKTNEKLLDSTDSKNQDTTSDLSSNQQKDLANQNEKNCSIELEERLRCGMLDIPQALCVALNCCWSIQADMNVPNCYYSLSQQQSIEDANQKKALVSDQAPPSPSESYDNVHEGVVVDWDESVGEKKKPKNNWDEQLGSQEDSNPPETDVKDLELKQTTDHAADKSDQEETDSDNEKMNQQAETISLDDDNVVTERSGQNLDEESNTPTAPVVEPELSDVRSEKISDVEPGVAEAAPTTPASNIDEGAQYHQQSSEATLDTEPKCPPGDQDCVLDSLEEQSVKINYNEVEVESVLMQALYLAASFPNEFIFVMTPIALKWNALLPKEYQDDLFGYSWPTICQTCMIGLLVLWIFVWRFNAGRQRNKTKKYEAEIERLRDLATQYAKETVDEENKKFALTKKLRLLEEENNNQSSSLEASVSKNEELMQQANDFKNESERKSQDLDAINQKVKDLEKEKTKIVKNLKDKEKELNKHHSSSTETIEKLDVTIQSLNSTIDSLRNKLEESEKEKEKFQKKSNEFEKNLTHSEKTFKKKEKLVKEYEVKTGNLKEEIEKLQKEIENLNAEKTFANNEIDSVKDCFLHLQSVQDALLKEGDEELDADELALKQKERVLDLIDTLKLHAKTIKVEAERDKLGMELQKEKEQRLKVEITRDELQFEVKNQKSLVAEVHQEMEMERSKLQSLENYYSKKESDVHQSLAQKHEEARTLNLQYEESKKSIEHLTEEVKKYREMAFRGQKEYEENNRRLKSDMQEYEKKSHSSWLSLKEAERNLDGANRQIADLQKEVGFLKDEKRRFESRPPPPPFIRPRPRYEPHSPFPFSPGSRPEPGRSPSTSMHSGYRTPDRPSSQADMRPSDPLEVGDGKLTTNDTSGGRLDRAAFSPPPHDRPPMDDGLRNMPPRGPPMIDPFYGPPSRGLPMGERPFGPHRGSPFAPRPGPFTPHGMNRGPPPRAYDGPMSHPPPTNRPGSRPDASGNSPYTDRRMHPGNDSSVPAMMPLHGNRSLSRNQNEYDLHPVRDSV